MGPTSQGYVLFVAARVKSACAGCTVALVLQPRPQIRMSLLVGLGACHGLCIENIMDLTWLTGYLQQMSEEIIKCQYCGAQYTEKDYKVHIDACFFLLGRVKNGKINKWSWGSMRPAAPSLTSAWCIVLLHLRVLMIHASHQLINPNLHIRHYIFLTNATRPIYYFFLQPTIFLEKRWLENEPLSTNVRYLQGLLPWKRLHCPCQGLFRVLPKAQECEVIMCQVKSGNMENVENMKNKLLHLEAWK